MASRAASWKLDKPANLQLGRVGSIQGSVACAQNPKAAAEIKLQLEPDWRSRGARDSRCRLSIYRAEGATKKDGSFQFGNVPPGNYVVRPELPETSPYYSESAGAVEVKSGETATVSLTLKPAVKLQGKVVDQQTGEGVPGVRVSLYFQDNSGNGGRDNPARTDAQGAFTLYTRPGKATMQIYQFPTNTSIPPSADNSRPSR